MKTIQLTSENWEKFYLNISLIEVFYPLMGNKSEIRLTTGRHVVCIESNDTLARMIKEAQKDE